MAKNKQKTEDLEKDKLEDCDYTENSGVCKCDCGEEGCDCDCEIQEVIGEECNEENENFLVMAQRIQAEFDNYRKRSVEISKNLKQDGIIEAVGKFLPAIDAIKKAKTMIKDKSVLEGVLLIEKELNNSLKTLEIEEIESQGQHYNPKYHNVIAVIEDNSLEDGKIMEVYQAGYKIKDRIIRYAQVIVNKKRED